MVSIAPVERTYVRHLDGAAEEFTVGGACHVMGRFSGSMGNYFTASNRFTSFS